MKYWYYTYPLDINKTIFSFFVCSSSTGSYNTYNEAQEAAKKK